MKNILQNLKRAPEEVEYGKYHLTAGAGSVQGGFSTVENVGIINMKAEKELRQKGGEFYEKAFDMVDRSLMWKKLYDLGISNKGAPKLL